VLTRDDYQILADGRLSLSFLIFNINFLSLAEVTFIATSCMAFLSLLVAGIMCCKKYRDRETEVDRFTENRLQYFWGFVQFFVLLIIAELMLSIVAAIQWQGL